ncbi:MAG: glycoside hydrolase family 38 C-terminal domain-containing protein [Candidatus Hodarchaeales archaeon]
MTRLVDQESLIRNYEYSLDLAKQFDFPLTNIGYLPDMFGHTRAIPQLLTDLTDLSTVILWRGVGPEIKAVPFTWKASEESTAGILANYLPFGYGNAASLPEDEQTLTKDLEQQVNDLKPWSPVPIYLLMNGSDHLLPQPRIQHLLEKISLDETDLSLGLLDDYLVALIDAMKTFDHVPPVYVGEFRSSARAHLLQDTFSSRMWIKQWNQKVEDLITRYAEPLSAYSWFYLGKDYPTSFLREAWKWHLRNQPHDSICGCSVDQTHEEMKSRYYWAESLANTIIDSFKSDTPLEAQKSGDSSFLVFNPSGHIDPQLVELDLPANISLTGVETLDGRNFDIQPLTSSEEIIFEVTLGGRMIRAGLKRLRGRKITNYYANEAKIYDGSDGTCEILVLCGDLPIGDFNIEQMKEKVNKLVESKKYKRYHVVVSKQSKQKYVTTVPLRPWGFTKLNLVNDGRDSSPNGTLNLTKDGVENGFYQVTFGNDGSFDFRDKNTGTIFNDLHLFEDWGDRGDEYTFGRLTPEHVNVKGVKRSVTLSGPVVGVIRQQLSLELFREIDPSRQKRIGKVNMSVITTFKFFRDLPRIDISTELVNLAKDHRLRVCFDLPFKSSHTITSTHFGCIKRPGDPVGNESYSEKPSGIQPQKRFIRVEDRDDDIAVTLSNRGLPEVELVGGSRLALTLIRATGFLSRADIPERPEHAGPFLETPGAQELFSRYTFNYSFLSHSASDPLIISADQSEAFSMQPIAVFFQERVLPEELLQQLFHVDDSWIRISSLRVRDDKVLVTAFNLRDEVITTRIKLPVKASSCREIKINGSIKGEKTIKDRVVELYFEPHEIKMISFS